MNLKIFWRSLDISQTKYELIKLVNFRRDQRNHSYKAKTWKCIQHIAKENLFLLKDFLEP